MMIASMGYSKDVVNEGEIVKKTLVSAYLPKELLVKKDETGLLLIKHLTPKYDHYSQLDLEEGIFLCNVKDQARWPRYLVKIDFMALAAVHGELLPDDVRTVRFIMQSSHHEYNIDFYSKAPAYEASDSFNNWKVYQCDGFFSTREVPIDCYSSGSFYISVLGNGVRDFKFLRLNLEIKDITTEID